MYANNYGPLGHRVTRRRALALGASTAGAAFLAACGVGGQGGAGKPAELLTPVLDETVRLKRGGIFISVQTTPPTLDPHLTGNHLVYTWHAYGQLFRLKPGYLRRSAGDFEGELVESYEFSPDKLTLTLKLKRGVMFAPKAPVNARELDAQDVAFSWGRYAIVSPRKDELSNAANPRAPVLSVTAQDATTVVIKLKEPNSGILSSFAGTQPGTPFIVPREADGKRLDLVRESLGSGPFYFNPSDYQPGVGSLWQRNPGYRNVDGRGLPYIDAVRYFDLPVYEAELAQFRAGTILDWFGGVAIDDILPMKGDMPQLEVMNNDLTTSQARMFFGLQDGSPFKDERVRQAFAMSWDRDLFADVAFNVRKYESEGVPMATAWDTALAANVYAGWWLDPQAPAFGPNAQYFRFDTAAAQRLLAAAGVSTPYAHDVFYPLGLPSSFYRHKDVILGMIGESKLFQPNPRELDLVKDWPAFRARRGQFWGMGFEQDGNDLGLATDLYAHYNAGGSRYYCGDANMDDLTNQMQRELDVTRRMSLAQDLQRYEARMQFRPRAASASSFRIAWPAQRNRMVWQGAAGYQGVQNRYLTDIFLDTSKPPFQA